MMESKNHHKAVFLKGAAYVLSGLHWAYRSSSPGVFVEMYSPFSDAWSVAEMPDDRILLCAYAMVDKIFVMGAAHVQ